MKTYIIHKGLGCEKVETREPRIIELTPKPDNDRRVYNTFQSLSVSTYDDPFNSTSMMPSPVVFDAIQFIIMDWNHESYQNHTSFGYYDKYINYLFLPQDMEYHHLHAAHLDETDMYVRERTRPFRHDAESDYRHRICELEDQLRSLESSDRLILPREEIDNIHNGARDCHDKPIPKQYFDENIFKVE